MKLQDLIGSKVWVKGENGPEIDGRISSIFQPRETDDIGDAVRLSTFRIQVASGDVLQTSGRWITRIDNPEYVQACRDETIEGSP